MIQSLSASDTSHGVSYADVTFFPSNHANLRTQLGCCSIQPLSSAEPFDVDELANPVDRLGGQQVVHCSLIIRFQLGNT